MTQLHQHILLAFRKLGKGLAQGHTCRDEAKVPVHHCTHPHLLDSALGKPEVQCAEQRWINYVSFRMRRPEREG